MRNAVINEQTATAVAVQDAISKCLEEILLVVRRRPVPLIGTDEDVVLSFLEWARLAGLSERTAQELRAKGKGPRCIKLTDKKLGVTLAEHRRWVKTRMEEVPPQRGTS
jgi:hypothetical protein